MKCKKNIMFLFFIVFAMLIATPVYAAGDYYVNINVNFSQCDDQPDKEAIIQLFADGKKVDGQEVTLNSANGYSHTYEDLVRFKPNSSEEIKYEV